MNNLGRLRAQQAQGGLACGQSPTLLAGQYFAMRSVNTRGILIGLFRALSSATVALASRTTCVQLMVYWLLLYRST